jgi:hypothetical protein
MIMCVIYAARCLKFSKITLGEKMFHFTGAGTFKQNIKVLLIWVNNKITGGKWIREKKRKKSGVKWIKESKKGSRE